MIAHDLALALDPVRFAAAAGYDQLDPWQAALLRSLARQLILNCSRQSGKSSMTALLALHQALYIPQSLVLLLGPSQRQAAELHRKVKQSFGSLAFSPVIVTRETELQLEFANGSRIVALPGREQTIRGYSGVSLLVVDEASRVPDELYQSVRPMLAVSGGRLILLSTPFGARGFFHHEWTEGIGWERITVTAAQIPRIPADWLERERRAIGGWWYAQEYECQFLDSEDAVFRSADLENFVDDSLEPLFPDLVLEE